MKEYRKGGRVGRKERRRKEKRRGRKEKRREDRRKDGGRKAERAFSSLQAADWHSTSFR